MIQVVAIGEKCLMQNENLVEDLLHMLITVLPYVEEAQNDPGYKPGAVKRVVNDMRKVIARASGGLCANVPADAPTVPAWYLLYGGESEDGRGDGKYVGRTTNLAVARAHYVAVKSNPYSCGYVAVFTDEKEDLIRS